MIMKEKACGAITDFASGWYWNDVIFSFGLAGSGAVDHAESPAYVSVNGFSLPSGFFATTYLPCASLTGAPLASTCRTVLMAFPSGSSVQPFDPSGWLVRYPMAMTEKTTSAEI